MRLITDRVACLGIDLLISSTRRKLGPGVHAEAWTIDPLERAHGIQVDGLSIVRTAFASLNFPKTLGSEVPSGARFPPRTATGSTLWANCREPADPAAAVAWRRSCGTAAVLAVRRANRVPGQVRSAIGRRVYPFRESACREYSIGFN